MAENKCRGYAGIVPVYCAHDKILPVSDVKPNPKNPNQHPEEQIKLLAKIITTQGWRAPVTVSTLSGLVVRGHGRLMAAKFAGLEFVPVDLQHYDSMDAELADLLADNKIAELAEIDNNLLADVFADIDLDAIGIDITGYTEDEYNSIVSALTEETQEQELKDPDAEVAPPKTLTTMPGDAWRIGCHRLVCGDSTDRNTILTLLDGEKADLVFTDPPYGMKKEADGVANDNLNYDDLLEFNKLWIPLTFDALKDTGCWYCWGIDEPLMDIYSHILKPLKKENRVVIRNYITWAKHSAFGINSELALSYPKETEKAWFVMKGQDWNNNNAEFFNTKFEKILRYMQGQAEQFGITSKDIHKVCGVQMYSHWFTKSQFTIIPEKHYKKLRDHYKGGFEKEYEELLQMVGEDNNKNVKPYFDNIAAEKVGDIGLTDVWRFTITSGKEKEGAGGHTTPKPIALCSRAIKASSREGEVVLDVFGGSGSTLIACEQYGRRARLVELEPRWCDTIVKRYMKVTGKADVVLIRNGKEIPVADTGILND